MFLPQLFLLVFVVKDGLDGKGKSKIKCQSKTNWNLNKHIIFILLT